MTKKEELDAISEKIKDNPDLPLKKGATNLVFGEGNPEAKIVFIGEAPGFHEDRLGRPFVGSAGNLLNNLLTLADLKREEVYITNVIKYRPPENRDPEPSEVDAFVSYLYRQLEIINPQFVVTLGRFSLRAFLPKVKISEVHGRAFVVNGKIIIPMFHPAAALRSPNVMVLATEDFKRLPQILVRPQEFLETKKGENNSSQMSLF